MASVKDIDAFMMANEPRTTSNNNNRYAKNMQKNRMEGVMNALRGAAGGRMDVGATPRNSGQFTDGKGNQVRDMDQRMREKTIFEEGVKIGQAQVIAQVQQARSQQGGGQGQMGGGQVAM